MRYPFQSQRQALAQVVAGWAVRARRYRNVRAAGPRALALRLPLPLPGWAALAALALAAAGAAVIVSHTMRLTVVNDTDHGETGILVYRDALPGAVIDVPDRAGAHVAAVAGGTVLALNGMQGLDPVRIDLCGQMRGDGRLQALRIGARFDDLAAPSRRAMHCWRRRTHPPCASKAPAWKRHCG
jgi:hypothetical protein